MTSKEPIKCIKSFLPDEDCYSCSSCMYYTESDCVGYGEKCYLKQAFNFLNKENLTLSECIKEWNNNGFSVNVRTTEIFITNCNTVNREEDEIGINIRLDLKTIFYMNDVELTFDLQNLLSKTIKAVEAEHDK